MAIGLHPALLLSARVGVGALLLQALNTMLQAALLAIFSAQNIRQATRNIMARAQGILCAATASRRCTILLRIIAFAASMQKGLRAINRACATCLARYQIQLFQHNNMCTNTCTAALQTILRHERITLISRTLTQLARRLISD